MFERFTLRARQVMVLSQDEARALKHDHIGTEHILLGLLREEEGLALRVLESLGITLEEVRIEVARIVGEGDEMAKGQIPFTPRAKKVLELALREALSIGHNYIGTEHILLGLVREDEGVANRILLDLGADAEKVRNRVIEMLSRGRGQSPSSPPIERLTSRGREMIASGRLTRSGPVRWEYLVEAWEEAGPATRQEHLVELGEQGWQLAAVAPAADGYQAIFQRPKPGPPRPASSGPKWTVDLLGSPRADDVHPSSPLTVGYLLEALATAETGATAAADGETAARIRDLRGRLGAMLKGIAAELRQDADYPPDTMEIDAVWTSLVASKQKLIEEHEFERAAMVRDVQRRLVRLLAETGKLMEPPSPRSGLEGDSGA